MVFTMRLETEPFEKLKNGQKKIELRLYDKKRQQINKGDTIKFVSLKEPCDTILTQVTDIYRAESFADLYNILSLNELGYAENELNIASPKDMDKFYSFEEQSKYGVVGFRLMLLENNL